MPDATIQPALLLETHRNQTLFSDYYLNNRVRERPEWRAATADAAAALAEIAGRWRRFTPGQASEAQLEDEWIRPVLRLLGHTFNVQVSVRTPLGTRAPDYIFYPDEAARVAAKQGVLEERDLRGALAVGDAKAWERPLDQSPRGRSARAAGQISENPGVQIDFYIRHTGLPWGILTNGRAWRLYHHESSKKLDVFYEVDLPALIEQGDVEAFKYFYLFFRRVAFSGSPAWLDLVLRESHAYEQGVSQGLKEQVYEALRALAQGFLDFPANRLDPSPETLRAIYDNSLIVLYRLLFILYAESRGLLPVHQNQAYTESYSLHALKQRVARDVETGRPVVASMAGLWQSLRDLWGVLAHGNRELGVPAYNGGLFDPQRHPFLERYRVGDAALRRAIDLLARTVDPATGRREFVDYRDLEVRHLGSIYEGLLEYQLRYAEAPLALRREKGREVYVPYGGGEGGELGGTTSEDWGLGARGVGGPARTGAGAEGPPAVRAGETYLVTDKGERKATGSYYTPDYIVQYIVEQTVGPVLEAIRARHADDEQALVRAALGINVLDPAMGSGHFLVAATDFIARFLVGLGLEAAADLGAEAELAYWRRRVAQACIYGVDLNPLAVELAKLSLWLATVARDKPLSFLDHHLRCGNSLVGARVEDLPLDGAPARSSRSQERKERAAREAGQLSMLDDSAFAASMRTATRFMADIEALKSETLDEVHAAERIYREQVRDTTRAARTLADIWTARHFGLALDETLWSGLAQHVLRGGFEVPQYAEIVARARQIAAEQRFFHWELEFPEVFFDQSGRLVEESAGFDAVVGNPPYVRQELLAPLKPYFEAHYAAYHGVADLYLYFYERGLRLLQTNGRMAYISSGTFARANFAKGFRELLPRMAAVETVIDFGENQPFEGAEMVRPTIMVLRKGKQETDFRTLFIADKVPDSLDEALAADGFDSDPAALRQPEWTFQPASQTRLFGKILAAGRPLVEVVDGQMYRGVLTGLNDAFIIDTETRNRLVEHHPTSNEVIKPILRGEDLRPWYQEDEGRWLIFTRRGIDIDSFPAVKAHLEQFRTQLEPRPVEWDNRRQWPGRKPGAYEWYEIQDTVDYFEFFEKPKIFWPDIAKLPRFSWDEDGKYINDKGYIIAVADPFILGLLQSRPLWLAVSQICLPLRLRAGLWQYQMKRQFITRLPIPEAPTEEREAIGALAMAITEEARARYALHRRVRRRVLADLGRPGRKLNQKLTAWWELEFPTFRAEVKKVFKQDIPLKQRDEWDEWLAGQRAAHERHTAEIVRLETALNARVYGLFDLTRQEIEIVEASTKYRYGEV